MNDGDGLGGAPALDRLGARLALAAEREYGAARRRRVTISAAFTATIALALALTLTPTGRALADRLSELVGIGDEPTQPRLRTPAGDDYPAVVIGTGETPGGEPFEIVASGPSAREGEPPATCIGVELPRIEGPEAISCTGQGATASLPETVIEPLALIGHPTLSPSRLIVQGLALPDVARVEVRYTSTAGEHQTVDAAFGSLDDELAARIGVAERAGYFVAFLPEDLVPPVGDRARPEGVPFIRSAAEREAEKEALAAANSALAGVEVIAYDDAESVVARRNLAAGPGAGLIYPPAAPPPALDP